MKRILIILLLLASSATAQISPFSFSGTGVWAMDFDGSTEYLSCTPALRLTGEYSLYDNFSDGDYNGWTVSSGAYSVVDSTPLSGGTKSLKCTTAGIISIPCNQVYGQWEFDLYKGATSTSVEVNFINSVSTGTATLTGYEFSLEADETIRLYKRNAGSSTGGLLILTTSSYITWNTWYRCKVTRNTNGQFHVYIKGGTFGSDYVLVSVTGGSGTNPVTDNTYTTSNYFVLDLDANDMIANIVCQQGEGSLDLNSYERIYHSNNRAFEDTTGFRWAGAGTHSIVRNTDGTTGSNLIPDSASTFNTGGVTYWNVAGGTIAWESSDSSLKVSASAQMPYVYKAFLTAGYIYKYTYKVKSSTYTNKIMTYGGSGAEGIKYSSAVTSSWQTVTGFIKTDGITLYLQTNSSYTGDIYFDSIIVQKLESRTGYSGKIISTDVGDSTTNYVSLPAVNFDTLKTDANGVYEKYTLEGWARGVGIIGTEKLSQGDFSEKYKWDIPTSWSIDTTTGKASYDDINTTVRLRQTNANMVDGSFTLGKQYIMTFTISNASTYADVFILNFAGDVTFVPRQNYANGTYTKYITPSSSVTGLAIFAYTNGSSFDIDDISIKEITAPSITLKVGNQVKTVTGISCVPSTFTKFVFNFQSNALVSNQPILLYVNQADTVYLDDVSLTKGYDLLVNSFALHSSSGADYLFARGGNNATTNGYNSYINASNNFITAISGGVTQTTETNSATIGTSNYYLQSSYYDRIVNQVNYVNGVASTGTSLSGMGKIINTGTFYIGTLSGTGSDDWNGKIGHTRITKFTDISQSNVNSTTLTTAYNRGKLIKSEWTGGSPIEVAFYDWKGSTASDMLNDKSGTGNNLTGTNIDLNDRVKVKGKFK